MKSSKFQFIFIGVFAAFIVIGVIIFALGGRGGSGGQARVVVWGTIPPTIFNNIFDKSELSDSKEISVSYVQKSGSGFDQEFIEALAEGRGPDVIFITQDRVLSNKNKIFTIPFESYSERDFKDTFVEEGELFLTAEGVLAVPLTIDPLVLYWNRDIFSNEGLSNPPEFWDEFFVLSENLTEKDGSFNIVRSTVALGEFQNINNAKEILSTLMLQAGNPIVARVNGSTVSALKSRSQSEIFPAQAALLFYTEFSNPAKPFYSWNRSLSNSQTEFLSGDLALYFGFASELPLLKLKNPNLNFDVSRFPQSRTGTRKITFGQMTGLALVKNSKNIGPAFTVLMSLTSKDLANEFAATLSIAPARRDLLGATQTDSIKPILHDSALWSMAWLDPDKNETSRIFQEMIESVTGGRAQIDNAISTADLEIAELLER